MSMLLNRVRQQISSPTGTGGPLVLASTAYSNAYQTIASAGGADQDELCYIIEEGQDWEIQRALWTAGSNSLARNTPILSSIGGSAGTAKMNLAGSATIRVIMDADEASMFRATRVVTAASDTIIDRHKGSMTIFNRATAIAVALAAPSGNNFKSNWFARYKNIGAGDVTITVTGATVTDESTTASTLVLKQYESCMIFSDGTNYYALTTHKAIWNGPTLSQSEKTIARQTIGVPEVSKNYRQGCLISMVGGTATFTVSAGIVADYTGTDFMSVGSSISKTTGAWAVGTGNGALDTSTISANWYHVFVIKRPDTGVVDILISLSLTPTMPTNYTLRRRIGSVLCDGSGNWVKYIQLENRFVWASPYNDANGANPGTGSGTLYTLGVPPGVQVVADISILWFNVSGSNYLAVYSPDATAGQMGTSAVNSMLYSANSTTPGSSVAQVRTDTSSRVRASASGASGSMYIVTIGWLDNMVGY
jgi:hypothetical protein